MNDSDATRLAVECLAPRLAAAHWQPHVAPDQFFTCLWRQQGEVRQVLHCALYEVDPGVWRVQDSFGFAADALGSALARWLPEEVPDREHARGTMGLRYADIPATGYEIFGASDAFRLKDIAAPGARADFEEWADRFLAWYEERAAAPMHAAGDLRALGRLLHTPFCRQWFVGTGPTLFHTLLLAHINHHPDFEAWIAKIRERNEAEHGSAMKLLEQPRFQQDSSLQHARSKYLRLNALIERLQQARQAPA